MKKIWSCAELKKQILKKVENEIQEESSGLSSRKNPSVLTKTNPEELIALTSQDIVSEITKRAPTLLRCMNAVASTKTRKNLKGDCEKERKVNRSVSFAVSVLLKCRNPHLSAMAYRLSLLKWHGGAEKQVRLLIDYVLY